MFVKCKKENIQVMNRLAFWRWQRLKIVPSRAFLIIFLIFLYAPGNENAAGPACKAVHELLQSRSLWIQKQLCALAHSAQAVLVLLM